MMSDEQTSLQKRLDRTKENLRLLQERRAEYVEPSGVPLQLLRDEENLQAQIVDLQAQLGQRTEAANSAPITQLLSNTEPEYPIFGVPYRRNPNFTGREDILSTVEHNFSAEDTAVPIQAFTGLGGVGKTQIALEYAYRHANEYDLIWWMRTEDEAGLAADYLDLANTLSLSVKTGAEQAVFVNVVRHWLENTTRKWLLIFDNAERPEQLSELLPVRGTGQVLVTSRNPNWQRLANVLQIASFSSIPVHTNRRAR